jgi:hypothetical protein
MTAQELALAQIEKTYPPRVRYNIDSELDEKVVFTFPALDREVSCYEVILRQIGSPSEEPSPDKVPMMGSPHMNGYLYRKPAYRVFSASQD